MRSVALLLASVLLLVSVATAQSTEITVAVNFGEGLIYFLVILFFALNFGTPIFNWLYVNYISKWVDRTAKEISKASARFTERMSDASRRAAQSIRAERR
jgi:hypothetical protein